MDDRDFIQDVEKSYKDDIQQYRGIIARKRHQEEERIAKENRLSHSQEKLIEQLTKQNELLQEQNKLLKQQISLLQQQNPIQKRHLFNIKNTDKSVSKEK